MTDPVVLPKHLTTREIAGLAEIADWRCGAPLNPIGATQDSLVGRGLVEIAETEIGPGEILPQGPALVARLTPDGWDALAAVEAAVRAGDTHAISALSREQVAMLTPAGGSAPGIAPGMAPGMAIETL